MAAIEDRHSQRPDEAAAGLAGAGEPPVLTQNLTKRYGSTVAVDGLDLRIEAGQVYGLLGPNGAGKTTTLRMLLGLVRPTAGQAWLFGRPCGSVAAREAGLVGALVDEPAFYPFLTGRQNLELLCTLSCRGRDEIAGVLEAVGLADVADRPYGSYSHGMRQRLGLAAALIPRPRLLILDEPAAGLDPAGVRDVRQLLQELARQGVTVLLSSHLLHEVQAVCSHVGLIFRGRLVASGPVAELLSGKLLQIHVRVDDVRRAISVLRGHGFETQPSCDGGLDVEADEAGAAEVNAALVAAGLRVFELVPRRPTLEDLYMEYAARESDGESNSR